MFSEADLISISAIQHIAFCERQCALIHIERLWTENLFTAEGRALHEKAHGGESEFRDGVLITRSIPLKSLVYGLSGIADVVEFHPCEELSKTCVKLPSRSGYWAPFPVEYKRGRAKTNPIDEIQLCAQVFCLEEMLEVDINEGSIYYGKPRRRENVHFTTELRSETSVFIKKTHKLISDGKIPAAHYCKKCDRCSLKDLCLPELKYSQRSYFRYMSGFFEEENV